MMIPSLALIAAVVVSQSAPNVKAPGPDPLCGAYCLHVALAAMDLAPGDFNALEKRLGPPRPSGYSLVQLSELARELGAQTTAVQTTLDNLRLRKEAFACIILMKGGHFALLFDVNDEKVSIVDPPRAYTLPIQTVSELWSGTALLIGRERFAPEESLRPGRTGIRMALGWAASFLLIAGILCWSGHRLLRSGKARKIATSETLACLLAACVGCDSGCGSWPSRSSAGANPFASIQLTPEFHRLGDLPRKEIDATLDVKTTITNQGSRDLILSSVGASCSCTKIFLERDRLRPGESTILTANLKLGDSSELREAHLTVDSNDPSRPHAIIQYQWRAVNSLRVEPQTAIHYHLNPGQRISFQAELLATGLSLCRKCRVVGTSDSPHVLVETLSDKGAELLDRHERLERTVERRVGTFRAELRGSLDPQDYRQTILFQVICGDEERARMLWPIAWSVTPVIEFVPGRLWLGIHKAGETIEGKFHLRSTDGVPFRIIGLRSTEKGCLVSTRFDKAASVRHLVEITARTATSSGPWRAILNVETDHEGARVLELPASAVLLANEKGL